ncbi:MAG: iron-sulfur cluster repair di-iron protein [Bryobacterales bacterium]|nr:iron-sulfur cluster repair di-iron protein [Bryobacterales bacterium]
MEIQENTSVGDIAAGSAAAASVLEKYGIDYCCGGKLTLEDACRDKGVSAENVRNEIAHAAAAAAPARDWNTAPLRELVRHIVGKHHEYLKLELPRLGQRVRRVAQVHGPRDPEGLHGLEEVYVGLWQELDLHMHKEEMMLFPAIERLEAAIEGGGPAAAPPFGSVRNPIMVMEREHDTAGGGLTQIRKLTRDFEIPPYACTTYRAMLEGLQALEADLHTHIHLENNILFPRAMAMEERVSRN